MSSDIIFWQLIYWRQDPISTGLNVRRCCCNDVTVHSHTGAAASTAGLSGINTTFWGEVLLLWQKENEEVISRTLIMFL